MTSIGISHGGSFGYALRPMAACYLYRWCPGTKGKPILHLNPLGSLMFKCSGELDAIGRVGMEPVCAAPKGHRTKLVVQIVERFSKQADAYEELLNKITYCLGVFCFGALCYVMGSRPQIVPSLYCAFFMSIVPMRWLYYRTRKWHYYLLDFCYYANVIFMLMLLLFPNNERMFMLCFSFSEGPLAWAIIVWRCSLVFNSIDKIISVIIHLVPGTVFFIIRWWDPITYSPHAAEATGPWPAWPVVQDPVALWTWLFIIPLAMYTVWQLLYFLVVNVLKKQRLLGDPEVMTSFRELARKAKRANNIWWRLSGLLGDNNRMFMYAVLQGAFTVATMALTVPIFMSYWLHVVFEICKVMVAVWNGGKWLFEVMPRQFERKRRGISETMVTVSSAKVERETSSNNNMMKNNSEPCNMCKQLSADTDFRRVLAEVMKQMSQSQNQVETEDDCFQHR